MAAEKVSTRRKKKKKSEKEPSEGRPPEERAPKPRQKIPCEGRRKLAAGQGKDNAVTRAYKQAYDALCKAMEAARPAGCDGDCEHRYEYEIVRITTPKQRPHIFYWYLWERCERPVSSKPQKIDGLDVRIIPPDGPGGCPSFEIEEVVSVSFLTIFKTANLPKMDGPNPAILGDSVFPITLFRDIRKTVRKVKAMCPKACSKQKVYTSVSWTADVRSMHRLEGDRTQLNGTAKLTFRTHVVCH